MGHLKYALGAPMLISLASCTGQLPDSFRYQQQVENFKTDVSVNTKIDILWVIDNSPSMGPPQKKIRNGLQQFAQKYMKPNWDIHVAVINQDTYLAHPSFTSFLNSVAATGSSQRYSQSSGFQSTYLNPASGASLKRTTAFVKPAWWTGVTMSALGTVGGTGVKFRHGIPEYGGADLTADVSSTNPSMLARLVPGHHDGPMAGMCWTSVSNSFFYGVSQCYVRDQQNVYNGTANCIAGGAGTLDSSVQCVNTIMNNTVRSGNPIISTTPPDGTPADNAWTAKLYDDFMVNLSVGTTGYPLEMEFNSISQLLADNEKSTSASKFFRPGALRVIVIATDEDDQSAVLGSTQTTPESFYNDNSVCPWENVDGHAYRVQTCPKPETARGVASFKGELDTFFRTLDGDPSGDPNYFVTTITPLTGAALLELHDAMGESGGGYSAVSSDVATRLNQFADLVGNGSLKMEITSTDYTPILDAIGNTVVTKKNTFKLKFQPTNKSDIIVTVKHHDGTIYKLVDSDYEISGYTLTIAKDLILTFTDTDTISIDYQPSSLNQSSVATAN